MTHPFKITAAVTAAVITLSSLVFTAFSETTVLHDLNESSNIDSLDTATLKSAILNGDSYTESLDMNGDGIVDISDIKALNEYVLGIADDLSQGNSDYILEPKGTVHTGEATYYGGGYEGGCAMLDPVSTDYLVTALNIFDYNNAMLAGAYLEVTGENGTINVLVTDLLPEGKKGDLDLNINAFPLVADPIKGRVPISWRIIPLNTDKPVSYKFKEGSTQYWCGVQVRNHKYPVAKLEYLNADGEFVELPREQYNYFIAASGIGTGPFTFRVTDIYSQQIIDKDISLILDQDVPGQNQFPV